MTRATREYLDTLDDAAFGAATPVKPKALSPSDPAARFTAANGDRPFYAYSTNYLVDLEHAVIVDVEATAPIRQAEAGAAMDMIVRTRDRFGLYPRRWSPTPPMVRPRRSDGWWRARGSSRTSR